MKGFDLDKVSRRELLGAIGGSMALRPGSAAAQNPQATNQPARVRESLDFNWRFFRGDAPGAQEPGFSDSSWQELDLPHDWSIEGPFDEKAPSRGPGGFLPTGIGWYRKRFTLPRQAQGSRLTVEFDGVYENSDVWINGKHAGHRPYGYIPFAYDLTPNLLFGKENVLAVRVDNSRQPNCRWYSGSGIYRHVWLLRTGPLHVGYWGTFVLTPRITKESALAEVKTRVVNEGSSGVECALRTEIVDANGRVAAATEAVRPIGGGTDYEYVQQLTVPNPQLWSVESPYLYRVRSTVTEGGRTADVYQTPFGIREAIFDADRGFLLNGERVKLNGVCLHHDGGSVGAAVPERVWERRLEILREMGCNAIRTSHNPYAEDFLDLCDRMGFLVMDEIFDEWKVPKPQISGNGYSAYFDEWHERDLLNFIHRDRNHPSVVLWSAGNEVGDQSSPTGAETLRKLIDIFHREDPTRPVTVGCDRIESEPPSNAAQPEFLAALDIVGYNYVDRWRDRREKYYSIDRHAFPKRRVIGTESPSMGGVRGDYRWLVPESAGQTLPLRFGRGRDIDVEQLWKFVRLHDYVAGDFMWTGIDHLGEAFWPRKGAAAGILDTCGFKKDGFYFYQSQWTDKPVLHLFPHWNWKGREGQFIPVMCYTNCDTVELSINGKSAGVKGYAFPRPGMVGRYGNYPPRARAPRTTADLHLSWDVPFEPGTLKAVGTKDGKVVATAEISTTGEPAALVLAVDRERIAANRRDVVHVEVRVVDGAGRTVPLASNEVVFEIAGEGRLIGVDNGDLSSDESYKSNRRRAYQGLCLAIVQSTGQPGPIRISASSVTLKPAAVQVAAVG